MAAALMMASRRFSIFLVVSTMPGGDTVIYLFTISIFLVSLSVHECAHGWMAYRFGDDTAARMGRLTLNPIAHISLVGTIILPVVEGFYALLGLPLSL